MKKRTKIWVSIGIITLLALILSIRDLTNSAGGYFFLSIVNLAGIVAVIWIWGTKNDDSPKTTIDRLQDKQPVLNDKPLLTSNAVSYDNYLLHELKKKCFPKNFMEPYDFEKVEIANELYPLLSSDNLSTEEVFNLRDRAINELGVTIDTDVIFEELSAICNPKNFMEPYDAKKVSIANRLYRRVIENKSNIVELERIREEAVQEGFIVQSKPANKTKSNEESMSSKEPYSWIKDNRV